MPITGQCGGCGHKFQAPDHLAGKWVKCPNCSTPLQIERAEDHASGQAFGAEKAPVPTEKASAEPKGSPPPTRTKSDWYVQTSDGQHHGPIEKARLDKLAAAKWAKKVDSDYRKAHLAASLIDQTQETVDLINALAGGDLDAIPDAVPAEPGKVGAERYQSQYDSLYEECLKYVRQNVSPDKAHVSIVWDTAKRWADAKQTALDKDLEKLLGR